MIDSATKRILEIFDSINAVPRQSCHLEKIHPWLMEWARTHGFHAESDEALNIIIRVPASRGYENAPAIVLQGHMDMVCEKRPGVKHDFQNDPILSYEDGEWLRAKGTSLGADNGIALAMFFDLAADPDAEHPALEILITSDEETGLVGAQKLKKGWLSGSILLNLDSETEGAFTVGCAGGMDTNLTFPIKLEPAPSGCRAVRLAAGGLEGGHSGIEINDGKANANVLLLRALRTILDAIPETRIGTIEGGTAHNAIPRNAAAAAVLPAARFTEAEVLITELEKDLKRENAVVEKNLFLKLEPLDRTPETLFASEDGERVVNALRLIPHGVHFMSAELPDVVETSMNLAIIRTENGAVKVLTNQRSLSLTRSRDISRKLYGLAQTHQGRAETGNLYPPWVPDTESEILKRALHTWKTIYGREAVVEVTHAGLECGAIGKRYPGMDMISFGPTILQPHSPDERLNIPSLGKVNRFFRELMKNCSGQSS